MDKKERVGSLNVRLHRFLGHLQATRMTFGIKKEYYLTLVAVVITTVIPVYFSFTGLEPAWEWIPLAVAGIAVVVVIIQARSQYSRYQKSYYPIPKDYRKELLGGLSLPPEMGEAGYTIRTFYNGARDEWYIMSPEVNRYLQSDAKIRLSCLPRPFCVEQEAAFLIPSILSGVFRKANKAIFNGSLLRQAQELYPNDEQMLVQKAHYFDGQCTNEIVFKKFRSTLSIEPVFDGARLLREEGGQLFDLGESPCANFIGASTLAVTRDGRLVIGCQDEASMANAGRFAPSGSGSVNYRDYTAAVQAGGGETTLADVLIRAMERELREELNLRERSIPLRTRVVGYARLLERGGKPDFFGITYLDADSQYLESLSTSFRESGLQASLHCISITDSGSVARSLRAFCETNRAGRRLSIQLYILADILEEMEAQGVPLQPV